MDVSASPSGCSAYHCEWGYLGAQISIASDSAGVLYALWNSSTSSRRPERIYFTSSTTGGATWLPKADVSTAGKSVKHILPTIAADAIGSVRIAWLDSRHSPRLGRILPHLDQRLVPVGRQKPRWLAIFRALPRCWPECQFCLPEILTRRTLTPKPRPRSRVITGCNPSSEPASEFVHKILLFQSPN